MDLSLTEDQRTILDALDAMLRPWENAPVHDAPLFASDEALDAALAEAGFLEVANDPDLGTVTAALVIERLARLPYAVEAAASALIGPLLGEAAPGPVCLVDARHWRRPVRYLREGARVVGAGRRARFQFYRQCRTVPGGAGGVVRLSSCHPISSYRANESLSPSIRASCARAGSWASRRNAPDCWQALLPAWFRMFRTASSSAGPRDLPGAAPPPCRGASADQWHLLAGDPGSGGLRSRQCRAGRAPRCRDRADLHL